MAAPPIDQGVIPMLLPHFERARTAGDRQYRPEDVEGHRWMFAQAT